MKILIINKSIIGLILTYGGDILAAPHMQEEKIFPQHRDVSCFEHSIAVAYVSVLIVQKLRVKADIKSLIRGALLHDYFLYDWHEATGNHKLHAFSHSRKALKNANRDFTLNVVETDIIKKHMFPLNPSMPKYKESAIVTLADKICAFCEILSFYSLKPAVIAIEERLYHETN